MKTSELEPKCKKRSVRVEKTFSTLRTKRSKKGEMKREPNKKLDAVEKLILMYSVELCTRKKNEKILDQMFLTIFKEKFCPLKKDSFHCLQQNYEYFEMYLC